MCLKILNPNFDWSFPSKMIYYGILVPLPEWNSRDIFDGVLLGGGGPNTGLLEVHHSLCVQYHLGGLSRPPQLNTLRTQKIKYCNKALDFWYETPNCYTI